MSNSDRTQIVQPQFGQFSQSKRRRKRLLVPTLLIGLILLAAVAIFYFLVIKSDPKVKIQYVMSGSIEQKGSNNYEMLYKSQSSISLNFEFNKLKDDYYDVDVNGTKHKLEFSPLGDLYKASYELMPEKYKNSYYTVKLATSGGKPMYSDNINVVIVRPNISAKEFIDNYLKTYSSAVSNKNLSEFRSASEYWISSEANDKYEKMKKSMNTLFSLWYDNVISNS